MSSDHQALHELWVFYSFLFHAYWFDRCQCKGVIKKKRRIKANLSIWCGEKFFLWLFDASTLQNIYENNFYFDAAAGFYATKNQTDQQINAAARNVCFVRQ